MNKYHSARICEGPAPTLRVLFVNRGNTAVKKCNTAVNKCLILLVLLVLSHFNSAHAVEATLNGNILSLPSVIVGEQIYAMEMEVIVDSDPVTLELLDSWEISTPGDNDSSYFDGVTLSIPAINVAGVVYWADFTSVNASLFRLSASGTTGSSFTQDDIHINYHRGWQRLYGEAKDIGVGADGSVWIIGADDHYGDYGIYYLHGDYWERIYGSGIRIDVDPWGNPWIVNADHDIYRLVGDRWQRLPGGAKDIGIGADGSVWIIGTNEHDGGYGIYRFNGYDWDRVVGSGVRIDVDPWGVPWVINADDKIYRWNYGEWERMPGKGKDIGIGADGSVWIIGANEHEGGYGIFLWNGYDWDRVDGSARQISVGPFGEPWVVNRDGDIYRSR